jgi:hypothetical protein
LPIKAEGAVVVVVVVVVVVCFPVGTEAATYCGLRSSNTLSPCSIVPRVHGADPMILITGAIG